MDAIKRIRQRAWDIKEDMYDDLDYHKEGIDKVDSLYAIINQLCNIAEEAEVAATRLFNPRLSVDSTRLGLLRRLEAFEKWERK